jgi:nitroreductase
MTTATLLKTTYAPHAIDEEALDQLFRAARTHNGWLDRPVSEALLRQAVDLAKMGPTSANTLPMRLVFVKSAEAKARLRPALLPQNIEKTMSAPTTAIVGYDLGFPDLLPKLFPHADARTWFAGNDDLIADTAYRNSSLQGGYLILASGDRSRRRTDVRFRFGKGRCGVLCRHQDPHQLPAQYRIRRQDQVVPAQPPPCFQ